MCGALLFFKFYVWINATQQHMKTDISWTHVKHGSLIFPYSNCWSSTVYTHPVLPLGLARPHGHRHSTAATSDQAPLTLEYLGRVSKRGRELRRFIITSRAHNLVGGWPTPLKNMKVSWDDSSQLVYGKIKKCSKPPTSNGYLGGTNFQTHP